MIQNKYNKWFLVAATVLSLSACGSTSDGSSASDDGSDGGTNEPAKPTQNSMIHNGTRYGTVVSPKTGRVWLDRNLGAERVCTAYNDTRCYGDYYQWGRGYDGHQDPYSEVTQAKATDFQDPGYKFVTYNDDWIAYPDTDEANKKYADIRSATWSKTDGSSICPRGFRVPTQNELDNVRDITKGNGSTILDGMVNSFLKLPAPGRRNHRERGKADVEEAGEVARYPSYEYRSNNGKGIVGGKGLYLTNRKNRLSDFQFSWGLPVRCIKAK